ncbi:MAG: DUF4397 domain-containing protein [Myxococcota bacterium]
MRLNECLRLARITAALLWVLVFACTSGCAGCGGAGGCPDQPCPGLSVCIEDVCVDPRAVLCTPRCGDGEACISGACAPVVDMCTQVGQTCDPFEPVSGSFYCVDWDSPTGGALPNCSAPCDPGGACADGQACFTLGIQDGRSPVPCTSDTECSLGTLCVGGACTPAACKPSDCEGPLAGLETCAERYEDFPGFEAGSVCAAFSEQTNYCFPGGNQDIGDRCVPTLEGVQGDAIARTCRPGLTCFQDACREMCVVDEDCSAAGESCLLQEEGAAGPGVGFCGTPCSSFELGSCGARRKCLPLDAEQGYCVDAGDVQAFSTCTPGAFQCEDGTLCVTYRLVEGPLGLLLEDARCMPLCNVAAAGTGDVVTRTQQAQRDATCPQPPEVVEAYVQIVHAAQGVGEVDIYLDDEQTPVLMGVGFDRQILASGAANIPIPPGARTFSVLPAGAPRVDASLAEVTVSAVRDEVVELVLGAPAPTSADDVVWLQPDITDAQAGARRVVHAVPDAGPIDVWALPEGAPPSDERATALALALEYGRASGGVELGAGRYDLYAWFPGADREVAAPLLSIFGLELGEISLGESLVLRGTRDVDDEASLGLLRATWLGPPARSRREPRQFCTYLGNEVFGMCEQQCEGPDDYSGEFCGGMAMSCQPTRLPGLAGWRSLCRPEGGASPGGECDPNAQLSECQEGYYCLEFGGRTGRCQPYCAVGDSGNEFLQCAPGQSCRPLGDETFSVGQCGTPCAPDDRYRDFVSCPEGLQGCKPAARQVQDPEGSSAPVVQELEPFCSASGDTFEGELCNFGDCAAGSECLFERAQQADLFSTLLSPYFGGGGDFPTCRPQCDPFDGTRSSVRCASGETCLVNFPWSADVGHCAQIVEFAAPFQLCTTPGTSCGADSVCVVDGGAPFCLRLCDYLGGSGLGTFERSTCPAGFQCTPFINDIGICDVQ